MENNMENDRTEEARARFRGDTYATETTGITIIKATDGYAECRLDITEAHLNAAGAVMGGAIYTLADFTFAVSANTGYPLTVTASASIQYLSSPAGHTLYAKSHCLKSGKSLCFYEITITDEAKTVAVATMTGARRQA